MTHPFWTWLNLAPIALNSGQTWVQIIIPCINLHEHKLQESFNPNIDFSAVSAANSLINVHNVCILYPFCLVYLNQT